MGKLTTCIIVLLVFGHLTVKSQDNTNHFAKIIERDSISAFDKKIKCYEVDFGSKINKCAFSSDSSFIYLSLSNANYVYCYDFKNNKIIWKDAYQAFSLDNIGSSVLFLDFNIKFLDSYNGNLRGETFRPLNIYFNNEKQIGLKVDAFKHLSVLNLYSGRTLWTYPKDSNNFTGIHDISSDEKNIILLSNNVYCIKRDSGLQWAYPLQSSDNKKHNRFCGYATHFVLSSIYPTDRTPHMFYDAGFYDSKGNNCGMESNILKANNSIFIADKEKIVKLDYTSGKEIWTNKLPYDLTGRSELFNYGNYIILINTGSCEVNDGFSDYGIPYIAVFDAKTGELQYKSELAKTPNRILYIKERRDLLLLVFNERIIQLNKKDFSTKDYLLSDSQIKQFGYFQPFIDRDNYPDWNLGRFLFIYPQEFVNHEYALFDITNKKAELINTEFIIPTQKGTLAFNSQFENVSCHSLNQLGISKYKNDKFILINPIWKLNLKTPTVWKSLGTDKYFMFIDKETFTEITRVELESYIYRVINNNFIEVLKDGILVYELN